MLELLVAFTWLMKVHKLMIKAWNKKNVTGRYVKFPSWENMITK